PWHVVQQQIAFLRPDGLVLICVPNIEHWSVADRLIRGKWTYEDSGVMDHRHIRCFTLSALVHVAKQCGLRVTSIRPRIFDQEHARKFVQQMLPALPALGISADLYSRRSAPLQYVLTAVREH